MRSASLWMWCLEARASIGIGVMKSSNSTPDGNAHCIKVDVNVFTELDSAVDAVRAQAQVGGSSVTIHLHQH
jgi:hypothetical protein